MLVEMYEDSLGIDFERFWKSLVKAQNKSGMPLRLFPVYIILLPKIFCNILKLPLSVVFLFLFFRPTCCQMFYYSHLSRTLAPACQLLNMH